MKLRTADHYGSDGAEWEPETPSEPTPAERAERAYCDELQGKILAAELDPAKFWNLKLR